MDNNKKRRNQIIGLCSGVVILLFLVFCSIFTIFSFGNIPEVGIFNKVNNSNKILSENFISNETYKAQSDLITLVEKSQPAVVTVSVKAPGKLQNGSINTIAGRTIGSGTGFFISEDGLLITNEHVVCGAKASDLVIIASDEKSYQVDEVAKDPTQDIAILRVRTNGEKVSSLKFANQNSELKVGQEVLAIGNPFGDNPGTVTQGIISGLNRNVSALGSCDGQNQSKDYEGVLQTDAAINSGNSGGPLLNMKGEVIGVNSATLRSANNISYTVPFTAVTRILDRYLKNNNKITLPFLGVTHSIITPEMAQRESLPSGALVSSVQANSAAQRAGIKRNDIITKVGDKRVNFSLIATLNQNFEPYQVTIIEVYRSDKEDLSDGRSIVLNITLDQRETSE